MGARTSVGVWAAALIGTVLLGAWLRWALAGVGSLPLDFAHLRHAHSHLGYFGVLFPLAWLGWRELGAEVPGPRLLAVYGVATVVAVGVMSGALVLQGLGIGGRAVHVAAAVGGTAVAAWWLSVIVGQLWRKR